MDTMLKSWLFKDYSPNVQQFLDFFQEGIVIINKHGKIRYINKPYCTFLNVSKEKATGADIEKIIPTSELKKVMESGERQIGKYHVYGDNREVIGNRIPIYIDGRVEGMIGQVILKSRSELDQIISNYNIPRERVQSAERQIDQLTHTSVYCFDDIVAEDEVIRKVKEMARKAARSLPPIMLEGESGTGKEIFAHSIHCASNRNGGPFIKINCAAIPADLIEAELFGYEKGAFTGAHKSGNPGKFELAHKGIIFLDEIGDMPLHMQSKLLRVLEDGQVTRLGGTRARRINFSIISATNKDLEKMIKIHKFRLDLFFRLNVVHLHLPPLRDIPQSMILLCKRLLIKKATSIGCPAPRLSDEVENIFQAYTWPGNVRELSNVIESAVNLCDGGKLSLTDLPDRFFKKLDYAEMFKGLAESSLHKVVAKIEKECITKNLEKTKYNISATANLLGIHRTWLYQKLKKYDIQVPGKSNAQCGRSVSSV